jgi:hypothetical protein
VRARSFTSRVVRIEQQFGACTEADADGNILDNSRTPGSELADAQDLKFAPRYFPTSRKLE